MLSGAPTLEKCEDLVGFCTTLKADMAQELKQHPDVNDPERKNIVQGIVSRLQCKAAMCDIPLQPENINTLLTTPCTAESIHATLAAQHEATIQSQASIKKGRTVFGAAGVASLAAIYVYGFPVVLLPAAYQLALATTKLCVLQGIKRMPEAYLPEKYSAKLATVFDWGFYPLMMQTSFASQGLTLMTRVDLYNKVHNLANSYSPKAATALDMLYYPAMLSRDPARFVRSLKMNADMQLLPLVKPYVDSTSYGYLWVTSFKDNSPTMLMLEQAAETANEYGFKAYIPMALGIGLYRHGKAIINSPLFQAADHGKDERDETTSPVNDDSNGSSTPADLQVPEVVATGLGQLGAVTIDYCNGSNLYLPMALCAFAYRHGGKAVNTVTQSTLFQAMKGFAEALNGNRLDDEEETLVPSASNSPN